MKPVKLILGILLALPVAHRGAAATPAGAEKDTTRQTDFYKRLHELGLHQVVNDYSQDRKFTLGEPRCAYANITGLDRMPVTKGKPQNAWMEVYTGDGDYFRKRVIIDAQGNSSLRFAKRNFKVDFCDDEWVGSETTDITIGNWVKQDSYHFKAYYTDFLRGVAVVSYQLYDQMALNTGRPWTRATDHIDKPKANARCYPDGFPCAVYLNGEFYGVFSWQLKKHRSNMNQTKSQAGHIHLDGTLGDETLWNTDSVQWQQFEVRNPKPLYGMDGKAYDGDHPTELIDETSPFFDLPDDDWATTQAKRLTAQVKKSIVALSRVCAKLREADSQGTGGVIFRQLFEKYFDVPSLIDYVCFHFAVNNHDGFKKNWQWFTYDGTKWFVAPYDLDCTFGNTFTGNFLLLPECNGTGTTFYYYAKTGPFYWLSRYYQGAIEQRYTALRDAGIIDAENICNLLDDWYFRLGDNYDAEWARWPDSQCINPTVTNAGWKQVEDDYYWNHAVYADTVTYMPGDRCQMGYLVWETTDTVRGVAPYARVGYMDSLARYWEWARSRIALLDQHFGYEPPIVTGLQGVEPSAVQPGGVLFDASGRRLTAPRRGLNIYRDRHGRARKVLR